MHRKFIAIVLGAALAVTGLSSAPVRAQDRGETAAIVAGVAALAILGATVANDRKHDRRKDYVARGYGYDHDRRFQHQKRYKKQQHYRRHERRHGHHSRNHGRRHQPVYSNRYHRGDRHTNRGYDRYSPRERYHRDQYGK
ncbi:hypothetical protein [Roseovarius sp.]|uniref:hypothetical protein n=1 Tax=Roseovarius sp. TaxID=1486281 RepID=UPI002628E084|nr:hypothetical protein [Roseovarius sp.]